MKHSGPGASVLRAPSLPLNYLSKLQLELTQQCNLRCVHCYADSSPFARQRDRLEHCDWETLMIEARNLGASSLQFLGGEPTLVPYLPDLLKAGHELGYEQIEIVSNLVHLSNRVIDAAVEVGAGFSTNFARRRATR